MWTKSEIYLKIMYFGCLFCCVAVNKLFCDIKKENLLWNQVQNRFFCKQKAGTFLSSRSVSRQVFSARLSLTAVFGMGTGGTWALSAPAVNICPFYRAKIIYHIIIWFVKSFFAKTEYFFIACRRTDYASAIITATVAFCCMKIGRASCRERV